MTHGNGKNRTVTIFFSAFALLCFAAMIAPKFQTHPKMAKELGTLDSLLVIQAHADDELTNASLIHHYAKTGTKITVVVLSDGGANPKSNLAMCKETKIEDCREREATNSLNFLGVSEIKFLKLKDSQLSTLTSQAISTVAQLIQQIKPQGVLVVEPSGLNGQTDHVAAYTIASGALKYINYVPNFLFLTTLPFPLNLVFKSKVSEKYKSLLETISYESKTVDLKSKVLSFYPSQIDTVRGMLGFIPPGFFFRWLKQESFFVIPASQVTPVLNEIY